MQWNESRSATEDLKYEVARELGVDLKRGEKGNLSAREAGRIGGNMVRRMIEDYQRQHGN